MNSTQKEKIMQDIFSERCKRIRSQKRNCNNDLSFLALLGWFTLGCLLINEVRSILENLVEYGLDVPYVLIKGLAVTERLLNETTDSMLGKGEDETGEK